MSAVIIYILRRSSRFYLSRCAFTGERRATQGKLGPGVFMTGLDG
jgi:hypothetical protein